MCPGDLSYIKNVYTRHLNDSRTRRKENARTRAVSITGRNTRPKPLPESSSYRARQRTHMISQASGIKPSLWNKKCLEGKA